MNGRKEKKPHRTLSTYCVPDGLLGASRVVTEVLSDLVFPARESSSDLTKATQASSRNSRHVAQKTPGRPAPGDDPSSPVRAGPEGEPASVRSSPNASTFYLSVFLIIGKKNPTVTSSIQPST